jgi:Ice-binding-like/Protein of unknown function (DUF2793)
MSIVNGQKISTIMSSAANGDTYGDAERRLFRGIQTLVMPNVISIFGNTPPGSPTNGQSYIVGSAPTGLWAGQANAIAYWALDPQDGVATTGIWEFYTPQVGWICFNQTSGTHITWNGTAWGPAVSVPSKTLITATSSEIITPSLGNSFATTLTANLTSLTIPAGQDGQVITLLWIQNATGGWTITYPSNVHSIGFVGGAGTLTGVDLQLLTADQYAILAYSGVTNTGSSTISGGNVGSYVTNFITGTALTYTPPAAQVVAVAQNQTDLAAAITFYEAMATTLALTTADIGSTGSQHSVGAPNGTYYAGKYTSPSSIAITTPVTLDAQNNPNAVFVFYATASTITQALAGTITLVNQAQAGNVVWVAGSSFTSTTGAATMVGDILAQASITIGGGTLAGRALANTGAVTISSAVAITAPGAGPSGAFHAQPSPAANSVSSQTFTYNAATGIWYQTALGTYGL